MRYILLFSLALLLVNCGDKPSTIDDFRTSDLTLPGGEVLKVETMSSNADTMRGMMLRTSIAPDHGMLFVHLKPGQYSHWMYQTPISLDTVWMDDRHTIVGIAENARRGTGEWSRSPHCGATSAPHTW